VQFYTEVLGFTVKARDRIERSGLGVPIDLVYLDLGGTVVELISYEGGAVDPAPQTEHLGYRMMALEVDDMEKTADYLRTKGVDIVWGPRVRDLLKGGRSTTPTAVTSSSGSGPDEPMCSRQAGGSGTVQDDLKRSTYIYKTAAGGFVSFNSGGRWIRTFGSWSGRTSNRHGRSGLLSRKRERICWGTEGSNPSL
jgi:catechol 2,3-dioxygenase-like lactoylglutathione lyase family enzyme